MANIPEFISVLRKIRDVIYPEVEEMYENTATLESQSEQSKIAAAASAVLSASSAVIATTKANEIKSVSAQASTLPSGGQATVSYNSTDGKFTFGLPAGAKGDKGESYTINASGATAGRAAYDTQSIGFSYLDITLSIVYFKLSATAGDWSVGTSFGRGEEGADGADGVGIASVSFYSTTSSNGLASQPGATDTYRITLTNASTFDYNIYNGLDSKLEILKTIEELLAYDGSGVVIVEDIERGGTFVYKKAIDIDKNTGSLYTANDGTVYAKLGGGFWVRQYLGVVNVKWFGAKGDGTGSDNIAIQKAINYSTTIFVPNGLYVINEAIKNTRKSTITNYFNRHPYSVKPQEIGVRIIGESIEGTVLVEGAYFTGDSILLLDGDYDNSSTTSVTTRQFNNHVENLTIKGRSSALSNAKGIKLKAVHTAKFRNVIFTQLQYGVYIDGSEVLGSVDANNSEFLSFEKCEFSENKIAGYSGIQTRQGVVSFTDCDVVRNWGDGILISVAGLNINGGNISSNGRDGWRHVGLNVTTAARPSQNRAVSVVGTMFENNNLAHIRLIDVAGYNITSTTHQPYTNFGATELSILLIGGGTFENSGGSFKANRIENYSYSATAPLSIIKADNIAVIHKGLFEEGTSLHPSLVYTPTLNLGASFKLSSKTLKPKVLTNVLASRKIGTVYTNTSIDDMSLQLAGYAAEANQMFIIVIDGKDVGPVGSGGSITGPIYFTVDKIVPAGKTYQIVASAGSPVITHWHESR